MDIKSTVHHQSIHIAAGNIIIMIMLRTANVRSFVKSVPIRSFCKIAQTTLELPRSPVLLTRYTPNQGIFGHHCNPGPILPPFFYLKNWRSYSNLEKSHHIFKRNLSLHQNIFVEWKEPVPVQKQGCSEKYKIMIFIVGHVLWCGMIAGEVKKYFPPAMTRSKYPLSASIYSNICAWHQNNQK